MRTAGCFLLLTIFLHLSSCTPRYYGENIKLWSNCVRPAANPLETYEFYSLPFCLPSTIVKKPKKESQISWYQPVLSEYILPFQVDIENNTLCSTNLEADGLAQFKKAIDENYHFDMLYDNHIIDGLVGTFDNFTGKYYLHTHWEFVFKYNGHKVISADVTTNQKQEIIFFPSPSHPSMAFSFTYSAKWIQTNETFENIGLYGNLFGTRHSEAKIDWSSIINFSSLVIFLVIFMITMSKQRLYLSFERYLNDNDDEEVEGWELIRGDVFRFPHHVDLLSALIGLGHQFIAILLFFLLLASRGMFILFNDGTIYHYFAVLSAVTSPILSFVSTNTKDQFGEGNWRPTLKFMTMGILFIPFLLYCVVNGVASHYGVTSAVHFFGTVKLVANEVSFFWNFYDYFIVWFLFTLFGLYLSVKLRSRFNAPARVHPIPRYIPHSPWYKSLPFQMVVTGSVSFFFTYIQLFYIFTSVWGPYQYSFYCALVLSFMLLLITTSCGSICFTYVLISSENHRWWWPSFLNGGSPAIVMCLYGIYYFIFKSNMNGIVQGTFYFTYLFGVSYFFFVILGTVGYCSSLFFMRKVYHKLGGFD